MKKYEDVIIKDTAFEFSEKLSIKMKLKQLSRLKNNLKKKFTDIRKDKCVYLFLRKKRNSDIEPCIIFKGDRDEGTNGITKKFVAASGKIDEVNDKIKNDIVAVDLYEDCIYLYDVQKEKDTLKGFVILEKDERNGNKAVIFTTKEAEIRIKDINASSKFETVDEFINSYIM